MTNPKCFPGASPGASPAGRTRCLRVVRPPVPLPTGTDHRNPVRKDPTQVRPQCSPGPSQQVPTQHLHHHPHVIKTRPLPTRTTPQPRHHHSPDKPSFNSGPHTPSGAEHHTGQVGQESLHPDLFDPTCSEMEKHAQQQPRGRS